MMLIYLVAPCLELPDMILSSPRMLVIIVAYGSMAIEAERHCIIGVGTVPFEMGNFDANPCKLSA
jgi:hypothetical protein